jgi:SAM-dependent methyltransferase
MDVNLESLASAYDAKYATRHYFRYREWLYRPFVRALVRKAALNTRSRVLDVGCGQGFFSSLFADFGLTAVGIDISSEAIRSACTLYGGTATFEQRDVLSMSDAAAYDCVFARGLSLYNSPNFSTCRDTTIVLLHYLKENGVMIFDYHTNLSSTKGTKSWIYHSLADAKQHFSAFPGAEVYFTLRFETLVLGRWAFCPLLTRLSSWLSRTLGIPGELVAFVPVSVSASHQC